MTYLFMVFAVVWGGLFLCLYGLVRRSRRLEREVAELMTPHAGGAVADAERSPVATKDKREG